MADRALKSCPFCGCEAMTSCNTKFGWQAFCSNESCFMSQVVLFADIETEERAVELWNKRAVPQEQEPVQFKVTRQDKSYPFWDSVCTGCGYKTSTVKDYWKYCPVCGRKVKWDE